MSGDELQSKKREQSKSKQHVSRYSSRGNKMRAAFSVAVGVCAVIYIAAGVFGVLAFGRNVKGDMLLSFEPAAFGLLVPILKICYGTVIALSYPLFSITAVEAANRIVNASCPILCCGEYLSIL